MDAISTLAGIAPGSALDAARRRRPAAHTNAQASYEALFHPADPGGVTVPERLATALFVARLHRDEAATGFYAEALSASGAPSALAAAAGMAADAGAGEGPYGSFPAGPLSQEDAPGPAFQVPAAEATILGPRLAAALAHAHTLVLHPRDAAPAHLQALLDAGWSTPEIVTLSQLVAFLCYQIRVAAGLRTLAAMVVAA